jgi:hypothetical protein
VKRLGYSINYKMPLKDGPTGISEVGLATIKQHRTLSKRKEENMATSVILCEADCIHAVDSQCTIEEGIEISSDFECQQYEMKPDDSDPE